ncbi:MAG: hypothetical protein COT73_12910 [Bdellovibrio sp. CG10_big_fil_rev_8_21_14_0_10_47_8]|nr:MAG: hypothetical protein COT73_12910 [Bdellovibrio sp. CG10_big_fil_rev_8_21_14_0_10_47_8]
MKSEKKQIQYLIGVGGFLALAIPLLLLGFQNCSKVSLEKIEQPSIIQQKPEVFGTIEGNYCTQIGSVPGGKVKVVIMIDMSLSNLGSYSAGNFLQSLGTDPNSARFQSLKNFVSSCSAGAEYAVVGFATSKISSNGGNCRVPFSDPNSANGELDYLKSYERTQLASVQASPQTPRPDLQTSYEQALGCAQDLIVSDIERNANESDTYYHVFFVTDGTPTVDSTCTVSNGSLINCDHNQKNSDRTRFIVDSATALGRQARVQPVFYGSAATNTVRDLMSAIATAGRVGDYLAVSSVDQVQFCSLISKPNQVKYTKSVFMGVPLTITPKKNTWLPDSNMNGIPDNEESTYGFNVNSRRSGGMLDAICRSIGNVQACQAFVQKTGCTNEVNNFGLTKCDLAALGFSGLSSPDLGIDSDGDGIPDLIEVLRGSEPSQNDSFLDSDGDGLTNLAEIRRGGNLNSPDADRDSDVLITTTEFKDTDSPDCPEGQETWGFKIERIPLVPVGAFSDNGVTHPAAQTLPRKELSLSHGNNEELVFVGFQSLPTSPLLPKQMWGAVVKLPVNGDSQNVRLGPKDFFLLGETSAP